MAGVYIGLNQSSFINSSFMNADTAVDGCRWSAFVVDGKVKALNIENAPSEVKVSGADVILDQI